ncbi:MAG: molybdopterin-binding protein [Parasphingopyxis sp.]|uniref:molybdopterin-binding protein n=1 Tax=Parasphingopyxis sp. TaxID=1920299 RepID=UPI003F9FEB94
MSIVTNRRKLIAGLGSSVLLAGCDSWSRSDRVKTILASSEGLTMRAQRLITDRNALAREFTLADLSPRFRANGSRTAETAQGADYQAMLANNFADYRLQVDGLVRRPLSLSLAELRAMPSRTQITRHDCVEGWSAIGQWRGTPLSRILDLAGLRDTANYIVFHCADTLGRRNLPYYESIDLIDAFHPQTILAYDMNGDVLPEAHGAPLRARIERQLGYKHAKFVMRVEAVESFDHIHGGKGGYWEDVGDYAWYAGI